MKVNHEKTKYWLPSSFHMISLNFYLFWVGQDEIFYWPLQFATLEITVQGRKQSLHSLQQHLKPWFFLFFIFIFYI